MNQEDVVATIIKLSFIALLITVTAAIFYAPPNIANNEECVLKE